MRTIAKVIAVAVTLAVIATVSVVIIAASFFATVMQTFNPLCLGSRVIMAPVNQLIGGIQSLDGVLFGDDNIEVAYEQIENAGIIYQVGKSMAPQGVTDDDIIMALMTAWQESTLINHGHLGARNDHNSIGLFQQQYGLVNDGVEYWGTAAQLHNPVYSSQRFYAELLLFPDRSSISKNDAIQDIQRSATPNAYGKWEDEARDMYRWFEQNNESLDTENNEAIAVIGDSITVMANSFMFDDLAAAGYSDIRIDAQGARNTRIDSRGNLVPTTSQTTPTLSSDSPLVSGITAIRNQRAGGFDPQDWMILLGTNDIAGISPDPQQGPKDARGIIEPILQELGPDKRVLWLTVWSAKLPRNAETFNQVLVQMTEEYSNLYVGDWASLVDQNPDWTIDHVHYSNEGNKERSSFLGKIVSALSVGPVTGQVFSAFNVGSSLLGGCNFNGTTYNNQLITNDVVGENTPLETVSNPRAAQVAASFERIVGHKIKYGAARENWLKRGAKGNFGHGDKERWFSQLAIGPDYRRMDCSGFMNLVIWIAYQVDYTGCSYSYKHAVIDGKDMTTPVMEGQIVASLLQPGDFIIKDNKPCGEGGEINHIVMVLGVSGTAITTAEASPTKGYVVSAIEVSELNRMWPNPVVSRWIGPGAVVVQTEPVEVGDGVPANTQP